MDELEEGGAAAPSSAANRPPCPPLPPQRPCSSGIPTTPFERAARTIAGLGGTGGGRAEGPALLLEEVDEVDIVSLDVRGEEGKEWE